MSPSLSPMRHEKTGAKLMVFQGRWAIADVSRSASRSEKKKSKVFERQEKKEISMRKIPPPHKNRDHEKQHLNINRERCHKGVSKNRGTSKWMVYNGNPIKMDDLGVPLFSETPIKRLRHVESR